jgi:hypothetical protein
MGTAPIAAIACTGNYLVPSSHGDSKHRVSSREDRQHVDPSILTTTKVSNDALIMSGLS